MMKKKLPSLKGRSRRDFLKMTAGVGAGAAALAYGDKIVWGSLVQPEGERATPQQAGFVGRTWKPDTCPEPGCLVEEIYSGTTITGMGQVLRKCPAHALVSDAALYGILYSNPDGENKRKNFTEGKLQSDLKDVLYNEITDAEGSKRLVTKPGISVELSWSGEVHPRTLVLAITGISLNTSQKNAITNYATAQFGAGKVVLINV